MTAKSMEKTLFHTNVAFVAKQLNGFVGETLIFAKAATRDKSKANTFLGFQRISYLSAQAMASAQLVEIMEEMDNNFVWDAECVEVNAWTSKIFEIF